MAMKQIWRLQLTPCLIIINSNIILIHFYGDGSTLQSSTSCTYLPSSLAVFLVLLWLLLSTWTWKISQQGRYNLLNVDAFKSQFLPIKLFKPPGTVIFFRRFCCSTLEVVKIMGINLTSNLSWERHITNTPIFLKQLFELYRGLIQPCMEYCSHI